MTSARHIIARQNVARGCIKSSEPAGPSPLSNTEFITAQLQDSFFSGDAQSAPRSGSLADLAALPGMPSKPTLRAIMARYADFPVAVRSDASQPYRIPLDEAAAFVRERWQDGRKGDARAERRRSDTLEALASLPDMPSEPTLRRFIAAHPDFPLLDRGGGGRPYRIDIATAARFVSSHWRRKSRAPAGAGATLPLFPQDSHEDPENASSDV